MPDATMPGTMTPSTMTPGTTTSDTAEADMRALLRLAGLSLPEERMAVMLDSYRRWLDCARLLDEPLPLVAEPATAFRPVPGPVPGAGA